MTVALETRKLSKNFGALHVTRDVDFRLEAGARHALIGPNGAGKTTFVNLLTGVIAPDGGDILLADRPITRMGQAERVKAGIARTFQINQLFKNLSVIENVAMAISEQEGLSWSFWRPLGAFRSVLEAAAQRLDQLGLLADAHRQVKELPYGRQRLVEIAIALSLEPRVLLLDEPAAGIPSSENHYIFDAISALDPDIAVLIIEHDMDLVFRFAKRITVLAHGAVLADGTPAEIAADDMVRTVYLGQSGHAGGLSHG